MTSEYPHADAAPDASGNTGAMARLVRSLGPGAGRNPPVELWNPPHCGDIDMVIARDGSWNYMGSPIGRMPLVKLFASVLRRDGDQHVLVTPVEKLGIRVEDMPFQAVEMAVEGAGKGRSIAFRTNVDDLVTVGEGHGLRFDIGPGGAVMPGLHVRRGLWARLTRALTYDLLEMGETRQANGENGENEEMFGIMAGGLFHTIMPARLVDGIA